MSLEQIRALHADVVEMLKGQGLGDRAAQRAWVEHASREAKALTMHHGLHAHALETQTENNKGNPIWHETMVGDHYRAADSSHRALVALTQASKAGGPKTVQHYHRLRRMFQAAQDHSERVHADHGDHFLNRIVDHQKAKADILGGGGDDHGNPAVHLLRGRSGHTPRNKRINDFERMKARRDRDRDWDR